MQQSSSRDDNVDIGRYGQFRGYSGDDLSDTDEYPQRNQVDRYPEPSYSQRRNDDYDSPRRTPSQKSYTSSRSQRSPVDGPPRSPYGSAPRSPYDSPQSIPYDAPQRSPSKASAYSQEKSMVSGYTAQSTSSKNNLFSSEKSVKLDSLHAIENDKKYVYGCVPTNPIARNKCLGIAAIISIILCTLGFFFLPRMPDFKVMSINVPPGSSSYRLTPIDRNNLEKLTFTFGLDMIMNVSVKNINYYPLKIESLDLTTYVQANASQINKARPSPAEMILGTHNPNPIKVSNDNYQQPIGSGKFGVINMPPGQNISFTMNFTVNYTPDAKLGIMNDPAFAEIIQLCVEDPVLSETDTRTTVIYFEAKSEIKVLPWRPTISGSLRINCPFQGPARTSLIQAIKGNVTTSKPPGSSKLTTSRNRPMANSIKLNSIQVNENDWFNKDFIVHD
ncbi:hypothetical protein BC833DRAFT_657510 [Globomyces pollinis-pini]|nr:hypothetical protein BC833DRAFT_657510 [Globomyces pollinis-pini]